MVAEARYRIVPPANLLTDSAFSLYDGRCQDIPGDAESPGDAVPPHHEDRKRGESVSAMLLFAGCKPGNDGRCHVDVKYQLISPDGSSQDFGSTPLSR